MKKFINVILLLILFIMSIINVVLVNRLDKSIDVIVETKLSNYKTVDTVIVDTVIFDTVYLERKEIVKLPIVDTLVLTDSIVIVDSVDVEIPIELKHYNDTLSRTAISFDIQGFQCEVNNLYVKNFLSVPTQENKPKKWYNNFGFGVGLGITYVDKFRIVPNVGIYYKLF